MKKISGPVAIVLLALCVSSCDFFRALAGRPTSAQLSKDTTSACCALPDTLVCADTTSCCGCCATEDSTLAVKDSCCAAGDSIILAVKDSCCAVEDSTLAVKDSCFKAEEPSCCEPEDIAHAAADEPEPAAKPAPKPLPAKPEVKPEAIEEAIISNIGQKTGFLKVSVSYNDVKLLNTVESGYYILIGTFKQKSNADRLAKQAEKAGQKVTRLEYANGRTSIALRRSDNLSDAFVALGEVRKLSFSPKDACILVVE
ncbi:MAG: SPOR domain-containing protein [Candidatus Cryptobacteroides sp.]